MPPTQASAPAITRSGQPGNGYMTRPTAAVTWISMIHRRVICWPAAGRHQGQVQGGVPTREGETTTGGIRKRSPFLASRGMVEGRCARSVSQGPGARVDTEKGKN